MGYSDLPLVHNETPLRKPLSHRNNKIIFTLYIHTRIITKFQQKQKTKQKLQNGGQKEFFQ